MECSWTPHGHPLRRVVRTARGRAEGGGQQQPPPPPPLPLHTHSHRRQQSSIRQRQHGLTAKGDGIVLAAHCAQVIPEVDSPGHFDTGACYPNLLTAADYPCPGAGPGKGTFRSTPDPSNPALWAFFKSVFGELSHLFPDPYVSLGGDEAWLTPWTCSPHVVKWMAANNLTSLGAAARWYEQRLFDVVSAGGPGSKPTTTMMWAPGEDVVSNTTVHIVWSGWPQNGPPASWKDDFERFTAKGQPVILSGPWYLTPSHPKWDEWQTWYHTDPANFTGSHAQKDLVVGGTCRRSFLGRPASAPAAFATEANHLAAVVWFGSPGPACVCLLTSQPSHHVWVWHAGMGTIWSDLVKEDILAQAWPLMNAVAEQLWSPRAVTSLLPGAPTARYTAQCARLQQRGILNATGCNPRPTPPPPPYVPRRHVLDLRGRGSVCPQGSGRLESLASRRHRGVNTGSPGMRVCKQNKGRCPRRPPDCGRRLERRDAGRLFDSAAGSCFCFTLCLPVPCRPPAPASCSPHTGVKLNNTRYADGNGPRTTADADACCHLCDTTESCQHWSFQVDASVPGKTCHWATLTYCCWLHASAAGAVADAGWTSDVAAGAG